MRRPAYGILKGFEPNLTERLRARRSGVYPLKVIRLKQVLSFNCFRLPTALLLCGFTLLAGDDPIARNSLRGIKGIYLGVDPLNTEAIKLGLTDEALKKVLEEKLSSRGIKVLAQQDIKTPIYLFLNVTLNHPPNAPFWVYSLTLSLKQMVSLRRDPSVQMAAPTWALTKNGLAGEKVFASAITKAAADVGDSFVTAFKAVNPK